jgi:hypothetical protein
MVFLSNKNGDELQKLGILPAKIEISSERLINL